MPSYVCESGCVWENEGVYTPNFDGLYPRQGIPAMLADCWQAVLCSDCRNEWEGFLARNGTWKNLVLERARVAELQADPSKKADLAAQETRFLAVREAMRDVARKWLEEREAKMKDLARCRWQEIEKARAERRAKGPQATPQEGRQG